VIVSLIITTYNWKEALELSILSALRQTCMPDEIIIADDGSGEDTRRLIDGMATGSPVPIVHVWQEDKGFRAARVRNKAIIKATGEYILFIDGDIILHRAFIADHKEAARPHFFSQGSRVLLTPMKTRQVLEKKQVDFFIFESGLENRKNTIRSGILSRLASSQSMNLNGIRTCNFAFWRVDGAAVNGFNEDFEGWGREDSEFAVRLMNRGVRRQNIKFRALAYHLFHKEHSRGSLERNDRILADAVKNRSTWCLRGLDGHLK
jgi:glycosyltransferase involved in cell wall biosynthesis